MTTSNGKPMPHRRGGQRVTKNGRLGWGLRAWNARAQRQPEKVFYGTEAEAVLALARFQKQTTAGPVTIQSDARNRRVAGWAVTWLKDYAWTVKPVNGNAGLQRPFSTWKNAQAVLTGYLVPGLGPTTPLTAITYDQCYDLVAGLKLLDGSEASASTKEKAASILRTFLAGAVTANLIEESPAASLRTTWGHPRRRTVIPSIKQVETLAQAMDAEWPGRGDLVRILAYTGLRWEELSALLWPDVDLLHRSAEITKTATSSGGRRVEAEITKTSAGDRNIVILDQAVSPFERLRGLAQTHRDSPSVASGVRGDPLNYSLWRKHLARAQTATGVPYTAHQLRHVAGREVRNRTDGNRSTARRRSGTVGG